jgi:hypothetical protein
MKDIDYFNSFLKSSSINSLINNRLLPPMEDAVRISLYTCFMAGVQYADQKGEALK